ncbi:MAG: hypothetical protein AAF745_04090 [Planctomycetota bacterium]
MTVTSLVARVPSGDSVTQRMMDVLPDLLLLRSLTLPQCDLSNQKLPSLQRLQQMVIVDLNTAEIEATDIESLAAAPNLRDLRLARATMDASDPRALRGHATLQRVGLSRRAVKNDEIVSILSCTPNLVETSGLQRIRLSPGYDEAVADQLRAILPGCDIFQICN